MAIEYKKSPGTFKLFNLNEYLDFIIQFMEKLNPAFVVERFTAEVPPKYLAGPDWGLIRNDEILVKLEKLMEERNSWQGKYY